MNHIERLQKENKMLKTSLKDCRDFICTIQRYLDSDKFTGEGELAQYVNVNDIRTRLQELVSSIDWDPYVVENPIFEDYKKRARAERKAGGYVKIDSHIPSVLIHMSDGTEYSYQEYEAHDLLKEVPDDLATEDYLLAIAQGW